MADLRRKVTRFLNVKALARLFLREGSFQALVERVAAEMCVPAPTLLESWLQQTDSNQVEWKCNVGKNYQLVPLPYLFNS